MLKLIQKELMASVVPTEVFCSLMRCRKYKTRRSALTLLELNMTAIYTSQAQMRNYYLGNLLRT